MRIFLSCQQSPVRHPIPAYGFWEGYFKRGIEEAGHTWIEAKGADWAAGLLPQSKEDLAHWREKTWNLTFKSLRAAHHEGKVDLFLAYLFPSQIDQSAITEIQRMGIPCVNFFCDNVREFRKVPTEFHVFDLHWVPEFSAQAMYQKCQLPFIHAPMPCWVPPELRQLPAEERFPPTFIGTRDSERERLFAQAINLGANVELRGEGWALPPTIPPAPPRSPALTLGNQWQFIHQHGLTAWMRKIHRKFFPPSPCTFDFSPYTREAPKERDYARILRESRVCLGVNRYPSLRHPLNKPGRYSRLRDIEAPMMGACYLTEWAPGIDHLYDLDKEILTYESPQEMVEKIARLEKDADLRKRLRTAGQKRALQEHSIGRTLSRIAESLNISK